MQAGAGSGNSDARLTRGALLRRAGIAGLGLTAAGRLALGRLEAEALAAAGSTQYVHAFVSRPDLRPPLISVLHHERGATANGLLFLAPLSGPGARGPMLVDNSGAVVYSHMTKPVAALNFRTATYRGKPVLTWWEGATEHGLGEGSHVILDASYRVVDRFKAGNGRHSDLHEFLLTDRNTALVTAWSHAEADLRKYGGKKNGVVVDGIVQELELPSGRVLFEWRSLDHVGLDESHAGVGPQFDYFHVNSIERDADGNYLVSARNTWAIYKIDGETGKILWRLGGKKSDFTMGPGTVFAWQHDARSHPGNLISVFDDGGAPQVQPQSKALVLALDHRRKRAALHRRYVHHPPAEAHALGSVQLLSNRNVLVGWGTSRFTSEYTDAGRLVFDAALPPGGQNYRTLRFPWTGTPFFDPEIAVTSHAGGQLVYASWNGATGVAAWQLETGPSPARLTGGARVPKRRFETEIPVPAGAKFVRVAALDADSVVLRRSKTIRLTL
jgi:Arylsulfotransferase (ASST)